jgi:hypothetical protein
MSHLFSYGCTNFHETSGNRTPRNRIAFSLLFPLAITRVRDSSISLVICSFTRCCSGYRSDLFLCRGRMRTSNINLRSEVAREPARRPVTSHQKTKTPITTSAPRTISTILLTRNAELICGLQAFLKHIHDITDLPKPRRDASGNRGAVSQRLMDANEAQ